MLAGAALATTTGSAAACVVLALLVVLALPVGGGTAGRCWHRRSVVALPVGGGAAGRCWRCRSPASSSHRKVLIVPLFADMVGLGPADTYWALMLPEVVLPAVVYVLKRYFDGVPRELEEAAVIDGVGGRLRVYRSQIAGAAAGRSRGRLRVYWSPMLPLDRPALAAVAGVAGSTRPRRASRSRSSPSSRRGTTSGGRSWPSATRTR